MALWILGPRRVHATARSGPAGAVPRSGRVRLILLASWAALVAIVLAGAFGTPMASATDGSTGAADSASTAPVGDDAAPSAPAGSDAPDDTTEGDVAQGDVAQPVPDAAEDSGDSDPEVGFDSTPAAPAEPLSSLTTNAASESDGPVVSGVVVAQVPGALPNAFSVSWTIDVPPSHGPVIPTDLALVTGLSQAWIHAIGWVASAPNQWRVYVAIPSGTGNVSLQVNSIGGVPLEGGPIVGAPFTIDRDAPTITSITADPSSPTTASTVRLTVLFSEPMEWRAGASPAEFDGPYAWTAVSWPTTQELQILIYGIESDGEFEVSFVNDYLTDLAGNTLAGNTTYPIVIDRQAPGVTLVSDAGPVTDLTEIPVEVTFTEPVGAIDPSGIDATGADVVSVTPNGVGYTVLLAPHAPGPIELQVAPAVAADLAGNPTGPATYSIEYRPSSAGSANLAVERRQTLSHQVPNPGEGVPTFWLDEPAVAIAAFSVQSVTTSTPGAPVVTIDEQGLFQVQTDAATEPGTYDYLVHVRVDGRALEYRISLTVTPEAVVPESVVPVGAAPATPVAAATLPATGVGGIDVTFAALLVVAGLALVVGAKAGPLRRRRVVSPPR